jgi:hypothetical protein
MRYFSVLLLGLVLLLFLSHAACQESANPQCISSFSCGASGTYNVLSFDADGSGTVLQYCCADPGRYPVLFGTPYTVDCTCGVEQLSTGGALAAGDLQIYFGEFATEGG